MSTAQATKTPAPERQSRSGSLPARAARALLTDRVVLLVALIVIVLATFTVLGLMGRLSADYNSDYLASAMINAVPLALLGIAELIVIVSGRGGIDLSVGSIVSLTGIAFGAAYGLWHQPLVVALLFAVFIGVLCGALNGVMVAWLGFPPLIATLATYYAFRSLALVVSNQKPINSKEIQDFYSAASSVELPVIGQFFPLFPIGLFTFLIPVAVLAWILVNKTTFGRRLYAIGTNDTAAAWSGINTRPTRFAAYVIAGFLSALVGIVTVAQFASARPDAGTSGNGMALPAITIAVLGGVAITGGLGRVAGVLLSTLLVVWLNAGILLAMPGNAGTQFQLMALGLVLVLSALLNEFARRRYGGLKT